MNKVYTVLLVEDEQSMVTLIKYNLEMEGYQFFAVKNGKEAIYFCEQQKPDLIISDIGMPEMDGFELRQKLIDDERFRDIPFIYLTATTQNVDHYKGMSLGVNQFLTKPFEPEMLLITINDLLKQKNK